MKKIIYSKNDFTSQILNMLEPMYEVGTLQAENGEIMLIKDGLKFGHIKNDTVYLLDKSGDYSAIKERILEEPDRLLKAATKAYWIVSGKVKLPKT